jgi:hypothetical protein
VKIGIINPFRADCIMQETFPHITKFPKVTPVKVKGREENEMMEAFEQEIFLLYFKN